MAQGSILIYFVPSTNKNNKASSCQTANRVMGTPRLIGQWFPSDYRR